VSVINITVSTNGNIPIYQQIVKQVTAAILRGDLTAEQALPSIRLLAKELKISVITSKRAYEELEKDGFIYTIPGKGSFVAGQSKKVLEDSKYVLVEEKLLEAISLAKSFDLGKKEVERLLTGLMEGEKWD